MMLKFFPLPLVMAVLLLSSCSTNTDYLEATTLPPVEPPEGLDKNRLGQLYPVPEQSEKKTPRKLLVPFPPTVGVQDDGNIASLQTMGDAFWVLNAKSPATTWTQLLRFWQQRNIPVLNRDLSSATMITAWFDEATQPGHMVRYRLRLEQGLQPDTTDIFFENEKSQAGVSPSYDSVPSQLVDQVHGNWLAEQLVSALNQADEGVGDSYLAATIELPQKVRLAEHNDEPVLLSIASQARLDRALSEALSDNDYTLYEKQVNQGVYFFGEDQGIKGHLSGWFDILVNHILEGESPPQDQSSLEGILSRLPDEPEVNDLFPDVNARQPFGNLSGNRGYLLVVRQQQDETLVYLRDSAGRVLPSDEAIVVLDTIRLRLI